MKKVALYLSATNDIVLKSVDVSTDQEPDDSDDEFVTTFDIEVEISGKALLDLLDIRSNQFEKTMKMISEQSIVNKLYNNRNVEKQIISLAKTKMKSELFSLLDSSVSIQDASFTDSKEYFTATKKKDSVLCLVLVGVLGKIL